MKLLFGSPGQAPVRACELCLRPMRFVGIMPSADSFGAMIARWSAQFRLKLCPAEVNRRLLPPLESRTRFQICCCGKLRAPARLGKPGWLILHLNLFTRFV